VQPCPVKIDFGDVTMNMRNLLRKMGKKSFRPGTGGHAFLNATNPRPSSWRARPWWAWASRRSAWPRRWRPPAADQRTAATVGTARSRSR
jgi:hypothetical protein